MITSYKYMFPPRGTPNRFNRGFRVPYSPKTTPPVIKRKPRKKG